MDNRFGGIDGRRRGGVISQLRRRLNPQMYRELGCNIAIEFLTPRKSKDLAELVGIILGDGGISHNQLKITLNSEKDLEYSKYVSRIINELFKIYVGVSKRKDSKCIVLYVSGVNFIKNLCNFGLSVGDKVKHQVEVPKWISNSLTYSKWCLRGLMDTDGGIFLDKYTVNGKKYCYKKVCFTNKSRPLIDFVYKTLIKFRFHPQTYSDNKVWLYSYKEANRYLLEVGSSNQRLNLFKSK